MNENEPRHPMVICGAMRELIERHMRIDGSRYGYDRLDALLTELEKTLTYQQWEQSMKITKGTR